MLAKCLYTHANVLPPNEDATRICNERFKQGLATSGSNEDLQQVVQTRTYNECGPNVNATNDLNEDPMSGPNINTTSGVYLPTKICDIS